MTKPPEPYQRLPGTGTNLADYVKLYLASDHLLQVSSTGFTESYKRFFFRDIQVISLHKTATGKVLNAIWISLAAVFGLPAFDVGGGAAIALWGIAGFWLLLLLFNIGRGPTCACFVQTAVQTAKLPSLRRIRRARKIINRFRPMISVAQGEVSPAEMALKIELLRRGPDSSGPSSDLPPVIQP